MKHLYFSWLKRLKSFKFAYNGIKILLKEEYNARIHLLAAICVAIAGFIFKIEKPEWFAVIFAIGFVITMEALNTSIENIADFIPPEKHEKIKKIKDLSAAAVLISAIIASIIGLIIFIPKVLTLF